MSLSNIETMRMNQALGSNCLSTRMEAKLNLARTQPELQSRVEKIDGCHPRNRCNDHLCSRCGIPFNDQKKHIYDHHETYRGKYRKPIEYLDEQPTWENAPLIAYSKNFRVRGGQQFAAFENQYRDGSPLLLNFNFSTRLGDIFDLSDAHMDALVLYVRKEYQNFRRFFQKYFSASPLLGRLEYVVARTDSDEGDAKSNTSRNPEWIIKFHFHAIVADVDPDKFKRLARNAGYREANQICFRKITERQTGNKREEGGARGFGEYCSAGFNKNTEKIPKYRSPVELFRMRLDGEWSNSCRCIRINTKVPEHKDLSVCYDDRDYAEVAYQEWLAEEPVGIVDQEALNEPEAPDEYDPSIHHPFYRSLTSAHLFSNVVTIWFQPVSKWTPKFLYVCRDMRHAVSSLMISLLTYSSNSASRNVSKSKASGSFLGGEHNFRRYHGRLCHPRE